jgi:hypothetical protein
MGTFDYVDFQFRPGTPDCFVPRKDVHPSELYFCKGNGLFCSFAGN